ncbi:MAG: hypothetical protein Q4A55_06800 [Aerococcus sp.]|nr:hypothetical protein [Aerococcus sp.]
MTPTHYGSFFQILRHLARLFFKRYRFQKPPKVDGPVVLVSHHQNLVGPFTIMLWIPMFVRIWVLGVFSRTKDCYNHYVHWTFTKRFHLPVWLAKILAWPAAHIISLGTKSMGAIPVFRGSRDIVKTMNQSIETLQAGIPVLIFPDQDYASDSGATGEIYAGFLHLEKMYHRKFHEHINFVPIFSDKHERYIRFGEPIRFREDEKFRVGRDRVAQELRDALNELNLEGEEDASTMKE